MQIGGDDYSRSSLERIADAKILFRSTQGSYSLAIYCAGLSVECMCRAFIWRVDGAFDGRHDLLKLIKHSKLLVRRELIMRQNLADEEAIDSSIRQLKVATNTVVRLWSNDFRFAPSSAVRKELAARGEYTGIKGYLLKAKCRQLINAADELVRTGEVLWTLKSE